MPLTAGEFVVNKEATSQNYDLLNAINQLGGQGDLNIQPIAAPVVLDDQIVGQVLIDFIQRAADNGQLAINPRASRADI